jgi:ATP-dependent DNA helicase RecG
MLELIESGAAALVVGTHAVIQEQVQFRHLALAIIDEQHRFGVAQRLALRGKMGVDAAARALDEAMHGSSERADMPAPAMEPHLLMMSATPIPAHAGHELLRRSGRLHASTSCRPDARPVVTKAGLRPPPRRGDRAHPRAAGAGTAGLLGLPADRGERGAGPEQRDRDPCRTISRLAGGDGRPAAFAHAPAEKKAVMALFNQGQMGVLVSTTVIEVGVDVPNASLMVIEHAERFGLSQLHQLRGRVGRGAAASACVLLYSHRRAGVLGETARERLKAMAETQRRLRDRPARPRNPRAGRVPGGAPVGRCTAALCRPGCHRHPPARMGA